MSVIRVTTNFNIDLEFEAAPFYKRMLAWLLDTVVLFIFAMVMLRMIYSTSGELGEHTSWMTLAFVGIPYLTYHLISEILMKGQSIGKKIMRIRVVTENGGTPGIGQYLIRWLIRTTDLMVIYVVLTVPAAARTADMQYFWQVGIPFFMLVADVILANSRNQQRLGDMLAHTFVINTTRQRSIDETVFLEVAETYVPSFPQVMQLSDRDINALKGILDAARKRNDYNLAEMASQKIRNHLKINTTLPPFDFLQTLLQDYNYLSAN